MSRLQDRLNLRSLLVALVLAAIFTSVLPIPLGENIAWGQEESWKPVTLIYTSDIVGKVEPCG